MGPKLRISFHGGHNTPRPPHIYDAAGTFLRAVLEEAPLDEAFSTIRDLCENAPSELPPGWQVRGNQFACMAVSPNDRVKV